MYPPRKVQGASRHASGWCHTPATRGIEYDAIYNAVVLHQAAQQRALGKGSSADAGGLRHVEIRNEDGTN